MVPVLLRAHISFCQLCFFPRYLYQELNPNPIHPLLLSINSSQLSSLSLSLSTSPLSLSSFYFLLFQIWQIMKKAQPCSHGGKTRQGSYPILSVLSYFLCSFWGGVNKLLLWRLEKRGGAKSLERGEEAWEWEARFLRNKKLPRFKVRIGVLIT